MIKRIFLLILFSLIFSCVIKQEEGKKVQWQYYYDLGMSSYIAKNYSEAIANFFIASQLAPNEPKVWNALGLAYMEVQEHSKSENAFLKALQVDKNYTEAKLNLGILYYRQANYEKATITLKEVLQDEAFPQRHMAFYYLGKVYQATGNRQEYINNLRKAVAYNPMFIDAQLELAQAYELEENYISAKDVYQSLVNNGVNDPNLDFSFARVEYKLGNYASAKNYIKKVVEDERTAPQVRMQAYELLSQVLIAEQNKVTPTTKPQETQTSQSSQTNKEVEKDKANEPVQQTQETQTDQIHQKKGKIYKIQVGAFSSQGAAEKWKERLEKELKLKGLEVVEGSGIFRVLYGNFGTREEAKKELEKLWNMNIYGFIVYE